MALYLVDDATARGLEPFALTRPAGELRAGALLVRERWERVAGERVLGHLSAPHLRDFDEPGAAPVVAADARIPAGAIVANARCVPALDAHVGDGDAWLCGATPAAVRLSAALSAADITGGQWPPAASGHGTPRDSIRGRWITHPWDMIRDLQAQLSEDLAILGPTLDTIVAPQADVIAGPPGALFVERGASVEGYTAFDTSSGPIVLRHGAVVQAFTRIVGPTYIGEGSIITGAGDRVAGCSIGERCRVHGEISACIVVGHSNKAHDGFVGHSYLGRWVNLGAGTVTSNLKNTYGPVQMWTPEGMRDTGMMFLGSMIGDYARTGIGTRLTTGAVLGAAANIFPPGLSPKVVPPFAWGDGTAPFDRFGLDKFLTVVDRQMARRDVVLTAAARRYLAAVHRYATAVAV